MDCDIVWSNTKVLVNKTAESYCGTAAKQLKQYLIGIGEDHKAEKVPEFMTNSFHLHVSEDIDPFTKQDEEFDCFHSSEGGLTETYMTAPTIINHTNSGNIQNGQS